MKRIGLTGPSGSGKGTACNLLKKYGYISIDTDAVYHNLISSPSDCFNELVFQFGSEIINNNSIDRARLSSIVFSCPDKLNSLNKITHKYILYEVDKLCAMYRNQNFKAVIIDAPALFESGYDTECDFTISIIASPEIRAERIVARDKISINQALMRINAQKKNMYYISRSAFSINNDATEESLLQNLNRVMRIQGLVI